MLVTAEVTFCVRGALSPLLANIYVHRFLRTWRQRGKDEAFQARLINYADDFVILSRGHAAQALAWTRWALTHLGLTLNETKWAVLLAGFPQRSNVIIIAENDFITAVLCLWKF
jgi:Reverse transcriptase (RNA-dependent DNA polymerase)